MERPDIFLMTSIFGGEAIESQLDPVNPDIDEAALPPRNPVEKFFAQAEYDEALRKSGGVILDPAWDEPLGVSAPIEKHFTNPLGFSKGSIGFKLGIARQERRLDAAGETWLYGCNEAGELVDARVIDW